MKNLYELIALDKKANTIETARTKNISTAKNLSCALLHRQLVSFVQIWRHDNVGNATLQGVYATYLGRAVQLKEIE